LKFFSVCDLVLANFIQFFLQVPYWTYQAHDSLAVSLIASLQQDLCWNWNMM